MKAGDRVKVETIRFLLAAVANDGIAKYRNEVEQKLSDSDVTSVLRKQVKTHKESIEAFEKGGRKELADRERAQLAVLETYLPLEMSDKELQKLLEPVAKSGEANFGKLMGQAMARVAGKADGGRVAGVLKQLISSK